MVAFDTSRIQTKLLAIEERQDINGNPYLLLRTERGDSLYCFPNQVPTEKWSELKTDKEYVFTSQESRIGTWNLQKFKAVEVNEIWI